MCAKAYAYLGSFPGVTKRMIDDHVTAWRRQKPKSIPDLYGTMLSHATNRQAMPNVIGDVRRFKSVLCGFDPKRITEAYSDPADVLRAIKRHKIKIAGTITISNKRSYWTVFAKAALSIARFLQAFDSPKAFKAFIGKFYTNEHSKLALPLLLQEEIHGYGFALACDFLKEAGFSQFVKPDTHLNYISRGLGITSGRSDYEVFKDVVAYCSKHGLVPYEFDKLMWLVGSGRFYRSGLAVRTKRATFVASILREARKGQAHGRLRSVR